MPFLPDRFLSCDAGLAPGARRDGNLVRVGDPRTRLGPAGPPPVRLAAFLAGAVLALVLLARVTGGSVAVMRMERDPILLPVLSGLLTALIPLGELLMFSRLTPPVLSVWAIFATYTMAGVVLTRVAVRAVLGRKAPRMATGILLVSAVVAVEAVVVHTAGWMHVSAVLVLLPLALFWRKAEVVARPSERPLAGRIRSIGFAQSGSMFAAAAILAIVPRLFGI